MAASLQPNSQHCFACGLNNPFGLKIRFYNTAPGEVIADYTVTENYQGYPGVVHGGIVAAMLDEAAGRAHMGGDPPRFMVTARLSIRYRQKVEVGKPLHLVGKAGKSKGRTALANAFLYGPEGGLLAEAEALLIDLPQEVIDMANLEESGWKVYPEDSLSASK